MPEDKAAGKTRKKSAAKHTTAKPTKHAGLSKEEIAAMKETIRERKAAARGEDQEQAVLEKIASMPQDRAMAERIHDIVRASAPDLEPRTWYGMPAYAKDGKVVCFFQSGQKFKSRYATFGFQDAASLDEGRMWPTSFALTGLTATEEKTISALVKKAVR